MTTRKNEKSGDDFHDFGSLLKYLRKRAGFYKLEDLASRLNYSVGAMSKFENNKSRPPDEATLKATFVPLLGITDSPLEARFLDLADTLRENLKKNDETKGTKALDKPDAVPPTKKIVWILVGIFVLILGGVGIAQYFFYPSCPDTPDYPDTPDGHYRRGIYYSNEPQRCDCAVKEYSQAIELQSDNGWYHYGRGEAYFCLAEYDLAFPDLDKAVRILNDYDWAFYYRGLTYSNRGHRDLAIKDLCDVLDLHANPVKTRRRLSSNALSAASEALAGMEAKCNE